MYAISNSTRDTLLRVLADFASTPGKTVREKNSRRMAGLALKKLAKAKFIK